MDAKTTKPTVVAAWPKQPKQELSEHVRAAPKRVSPAPTREQAEEAVLLEPFTLGRAGEIDDRQPGGVLLQRLQRGPVEVLVADELEAVERRDRIRVGQG